MIPITSDFSLLTYCAPPLQNSAIEKAFLFHLPTKLYISTDSSPVDSNTHNICSDLIDLFVDFGSLYGPEPNLKRRLSDAQSRSRSPAGRMNASTDSSGSTPMQVRHPATSRVKMQTGLTLAHWEMDERLSLIALLRPGIIDRQAALVDFNVDVFRQGILQIQRVENEVNA